MFEKEREEKRQNEKTKENENGISFGAAEVPGGQAAGGETRVLCFKTIYLRIVYNSKYICMCIDIYIYVYIYIHM